MGKINTGVLKDFTDGTYVHDVDFDQTFEIIRTAINDNYDKIVNRYTKAEVDGLLYTSGLGVASAVAVVDVLPTGTIQGKFYLKNPENVLWYYTGSTWIQVTVAGDLTSVNTTLTNSITAHTGNTNNPHGVTTAQIGAIPLSQKAAINGVPSLGSDGYVPLNQLGNSMPKTSIVKRVLSSGQIASQGSSGSGGSASWYQQSYLSVSGTVDRAVNVTTFTYTYHANGTGTVNAKGWYQVDSGAKTYFQQYTSADTASHTRTETINGNYNNSVITVGYDLQSLGGSTLYGDSMAINGTLWERYTIAGE